MKIAYEPHPVTPARKSELRAQGFKIIDASFAPEVAPKPVDEVEEKPRRGRPRKDATDGL